MSVAEWSVCQPRLLEDPTADATCEAWPPNTGKEPANIMMTKWKGRIPLPSLKSGWSRRPYHHHYSPFLLSSDMCLTLLTPHSGPNVVAKICCCIAQPLDGFFLSLLLAMISVVRRWSPYRPPKYDADFSSNTMLGGLGPTTLVGSRVSPSSEQLASSCYSCCSRGSPPDVGGSVRRVQVDQLQARSEESDFIAIITGCLYNKGESPRSRGLGCEGDVHNLMTWRRTVKWK